LKAKISFSAGKPERREEKQFRHARHGDDDHKLNENSGFS